MKGQFYIEDDTEANSSGITINYERCTFDVRKRVSREFEFISAMKSLTADIFLQNIAQNDHKIFLPLVRNGVEKGNQFEFELEEEENNIYELTITRNKSGSVVDFEFDFVIKPIYFYHRALMLKLVKSFTSIGLNSSEDLKITAWDKFDEVKGNTQDRIKSTLLTTTNTLNGLIQSPKLIVPFSQNNDLNTPAYVFCLGTLNISRDLENAYQNQYQHLNISLKGFQLQYFQTLSTWQKYELDLLKTSLVNDEIFNGLNDKVFNVIEELEMYFKFSRKRKNASLSIKELDKAELAIDGNVSDIRVNMTSERYNSLINFNKMTEITGKNLANKIMLHEKQDILNSATKTGMIRKRGARVEYWVRQFAVLSGSYLYFYDEDIDNSDTYESWFFLKDAHVGEYKEDKTQKHLFYIMNEQHHFIIYVQDEETMKCWIKELNKKIFDIGNIVDDFSGAKVQEEKVDPSNPNTTSTSKLDAIMLSVNLNFENLEYNMINNDFSKFLNLKLSGMQLSSTTVSKANINTETEQVVSHDKKYSTLLDIDLNKIKITDIGNNMVLSESSKNVKASIKILDKTSKFYQGDSLVITFDFDKIAINFLPESIKKMVTFLKNTGYKETDNRKRLIKMNTNLSEEVKSNSFRETLTTNIDKKDDFDLIGSKSVMKLFLFFKTTDFTWINPITKKPFVHINAENLRPTYELWQGLHKLDIT